MAKVNFLGFCPDLDVTTPGILTDCAGIYPTQRGFKPLLAPVAQYPALASAALGEAFLAQYLDGTTRLFVGTATHLYELTNGTTITEKAGGTTFSGGAWRFAMFGNDCIATNGTDAVQKVGTSGNFGALGGTPPNAPLVETVYGFVFLFETDNWHCSGLGNDASWDNSVTDLSATGQLLDTPGSITAARKLNRSIIAYKANGVYLGQFVGAPLVWQWTLIAPVPGAAGQGSVISIGNQQAFVGTDDFFLTDGTQVWPIPGPDGNVNPIKHWFFDSNANPAYLNKIEGYFDQLNETVTWHFSSTSANPAGTLDSTVSWNYRTNKWTHDTGINIEAVVRPVYVAGTSWSYDKFSNTYGTYDAIPALNYDNPLFFGTSNGYQAYIDTSHILQARTGSSGNSSMTTGDFGDNVNWWYLNRIRPMFAIAPGKASNLAIQGYHRQNSGASYTVGDNIAMSADGFVELRASDAFHAMQLNFTGGYEIIGIDPELQKDGLI